jgi:REP element-mobilizing transposase RayT
VNRCAIFVDDVDRRHFYDLLCDATAEHGIAVHAYVFMGNHIHLLLTPPAHEALSRAMRNFGQCYVQAFNKRHRRSGTLWQGRIQVMPGRHRTLPVDRLPLHRAQSRASFDGEPPRALSMVKRACEPGND